MYETINEHLKNNFYQNPEIQKLIIKNEQRVLSNEISSFIAANELLNNYFKL
jgi:LAO/AO transport system kinase